MAGYSSASWAIGVLFSDCITKDTPPPFTSPNTTFGYTPALERRHDAESAGFQALLMQLSGRQTKKGAAVTTSGMLAGLWVFQGALGPLARHGPDKLNSML